MTATNIIEKILEKQNISKAELARKLGISRQNLNNKMLRDNFSAKELYEISNVLDAKFIIIDKNGDKYHINYI